MTSNNRKKRELSGMGANKHLIFLILDAAGFRNWRTNFWFFVDLFACLTSPASRGRSGELFNLHPMGKKVVLADKERSRKPSVRQTCSNMSLREVNPEVEGGYMDGNKEMCPPEFACQADKSQSRARVSAKLTLTGPGGGRKTRRRRICPPDIFPRAREADARRAGGRSVRQTNFDRPGRRTQDAPKADLSARKLPRASRGRSGELFNLHPMGKKVVLADKERSRKPSVRQTCSNMSLREVNPEVEGGYMDGNKEMCPPEFACQADKSQSRARVSAKLTLTGPGRRTQDAPEADLSARQLSAGPGGGRKTRRRQICPPNNFPQAREADARRAGGRSVRQTSAASFKGLFQLDAPKADLSARQLSASRGLQMAGRRLLYSLRRWGECRKTHLLTSRRTLPVMRAGRVFAGRCQSTGGKTPFCSRPTWPRSMPSHCWTVRI